jgi:hypothetical protein
MVSDQTTSLNGLSLNAPTIAFLSKIKIHIKAFGFMVFI